MVPSKQERILFEGHDENVLEAEGVVNDPKAAERRRLLAAGWEPKEQGGKSVWRNPKNGFWYPERVAIALLGEDPEREDGPNEPEDEA